MVSPHILKHLAMYAANDLRTIFLVDDERILGIGLQVAV